jgi:hypothetical protein
MSDTVRAHLVYAFRKVLRPLVKILIRAGVRYDEFTEVLKGVYVESAIRDGLGKAGPVTRSRVALVTGVTRRDVDRYVDDESLLAPPPPTHATVLIEVLHLWNTDPRYLGPYGVPLEIDFDSTPDRCFVDLVSQVDEDVDPGIVLEDLRRSGAVVSSGERYLKVTSRSYVIGDLMSPQALEYFGNTIASLARTLEHNMGGPSAARRLQRSVIADRGMPQELLPEFEVYVKARVQLMLSDVDDWIGQNITKWGLDENSALPTGVTVYHYVGQASEDKRTLRGCLGESA